MNTEGIILSPTPVSTGTAKPEVHSSMRNVVCYVGKKGRRIVFQSVRVLILNKIFVVLLIDIVLCQSMIYAYRHNKS